MPEASRGGDQLATGNVAVFTVVGLLASFRLCHVRLLWSDEDYHLAAALQILHGKLPYRDFWYDKPPLSALYYTLIGGYSGWPLRILDTLYVLLACFLAYRLARAWWGQSEARLAALFLAFFLTFYLPSAVIGFAADALMLAPHLAAIYYTFVRKPFTAGLCCGIAFLVNAKAVFVCAVCAIWLVGSWTALCAGFFLPVASAAAFVLLSGSWGSYWEQVWRWGWIYAAQSPVVHPWKEGFLRTLDWVGFHIALAGAAAFIFVSGSRGERWKLWVWLLLSFAAVCLGTRFSPRYFLQLLPVLVIAGSRGAVLAWRRARIATTICFVAALSVPVIRFGPHYFFLAADGIQGLASHWTDVAMDSDARQAADLIRSSFRPGDTLFVWGYRPDIYVYTRLISDGKFWDSQPLTGIPADRHLHASEPIYSGPAAVNRQQFIETAPTWLVDGSSLLNPNLKAENYPELRPWLSHYELIGRTKMCLIYRRAD